MVSSLVMTIRQGLGVSYVVLSGERNRRKRNEAGWRRGGVRESPELGPSPPVLLVGYQSKLRFSPGCRERIRTVRIHCVLAPRDSAFHGKLRFTSPQSGSRSCAVGTRRPRLEPAPVHQRCQRHRGEDSATSEPGRQYCPAAPRPNIRPTRARRPCSWDKSANTARLVRGASRQRATRSI